MPKHKAKDEIFVCVICSNDVRRDKSWQYGPGSYGPTRACRTHLKVQRAHEAEMAASRQPPSGRTATPLLNVSTPRPTAANGHSLRKEEIIEKLRGKSPGTKVRVTFGGLEDGIAAVRFIYLMVDRIITVDDPNLFGLYDVAVTARWGNNPRTFELTLNFRSDDDLEHWFAHRLRDQITQLEVL